MPSKFDFGDDQLNLTARPAQEQRTKDPTEAQRIRQTIPSTLISMAVTIWIYSIILKSWPVAIGSVLMIFVHELGHAIAARRFGLPYLGMRFIPLLGGVVFHQKGNTTVVQDAFVGIMGPVFGTLFGLGCVVGSLIVAPSYENSWHFFWLLLARWSFIVNLLNLMVPAPPLDGHWLAAVFTKTSRATSVERLKYAFAWAGLGGLLIGGILYCNAQLG